MNKDAHWANHETFDQQHSLGLGLEEVQKSSQQLPQLSLKYSKSLSRQLRNQSNQNTKFCLRHSTLGSTDILLHQTHAQLRAQLTCSQAFKCVS